MSAEHETCSAHSIANERCEIVFPSMCARKLRKADFKAVQSAGTLTVKAKVLSLNVRPMEDTFKSLWCASWLIVDYMLWFTSFRRPN